MYATRLKFNPEIAEAIGLRNRLAEDGFIGSQPLVVMSDGQRYTLEDEFMRLYPRKTIEQLLRVKEDGFCIVLATIKEIVKDIEPCYPACKCNKAARPDSSIYYCDGCNRAVINVAPRYKIKIEVEDENDIAVLMAFDRDGQFLLKKSCADMINEMHKSVVGSKYSDLLDGLVGKKLLFKVKTKSGSTSQFDSSYSVRRL